MPIGPGASPSSCVPGAAPRPSTASMHASAGAPGSRPARGGSRPVPGRAGGRGDGSRGLAGRLGLLRRPAASTASASAAGGRGGSWPGSPGRSGRTRLPTQPASGRRWLCVLGRALSGAEQRTGGGSCRRTDAHRRALACSLQMLQCCAQCLFIDQKSTAAC